MSQKALYIVFSGTIQMLKQDLQEKQIYNVHTLIYISSDLLIQCWISGCSDKIKICFCFDKVVAKCIYAGRFAALYRVSGIVRKCEYKTTTIIIYYDVLFSFYLREIFPFALSIPQIRACLLRIQRRRGCRGTYRPRWLAGRISAHRIRRCGRGTCI